MLVVLNCCLIHVLLKIETISLGTQADASHDSNPVTTCSRDPDQIVCQTGQPEMPTIPIFAESYLFFKADFRITILNVKITANNDLKMVPDKIMVVTPFSALVIPDHR